MIEEHQSFLLWHFNTAVEPGKILPRRKNSTRDTFLSWWTLILHTTETSTSSNHESLDYPGIIMKRCFTGMRKRNRLFQKFGYCAKFRSAWNHYKDALYSECEWSQTFLKTVKFISKKQSVICNLSELVLDDKVARLDKEKAEALNAFFTSCLNNSCSPLTHVESVLQPCAQ